MCELGVVGAIPIALLGGVAIALLGGVAIALLGGVAIALLGGVAIGFPSAGLDFDFHLLLDQTLRNFNQHVGTGHATSNAMC